ncbi:hypothetical protein FA95DRAFT_1578889, partial [Auriscalpium vulgare]
MADPSAFADFARDIVVADLASVEADLPASGTVAERQAWCVRAAVVSERLWALLGRAIALPPGVADRLRLLDSAVARLRPADPAPAPTFAPLAPFPAPSPPAASPARPTPAPRKKKSVKKPARVEVLIPARPAVPPPVVAAAPAVVTPEPEPAPLSPRDERAQRHAARRDRAAVAPAPVAPPPAVTAPVPAAPPTRKRTRSQARKKTRAPIDADVLSSEVDDEGDPLYKTSRIRPTFVERYAGERVPTSQRCTYCRYHFDAPADCYFKPHSLA